MKKKAALRDVVARFVVTPVVALDGERPPHPRLGIEPRRRLLERAEEDEALRDLRASPPREARKTCAISLRFESGVLPSPVSGT